MIPTTRQQLEALWDVADQGKVWLYFKHTERTGLNHQRSAAKRKRIEAEAKLCDLCDAVAAVPEGEPLKEGPKDAFHASANEVAILWSIWEETAAFLNSTIEYAESGVGKKRVEAAMMRLFRLHEELAYYRKGPEVDATA